MLLETQRAEITYINHWNCQKIFSYKNLQKKIEYIWKIIVK